MKGRKKKAGYKVIDTDNTTSSEKTELPHREVCYDILKENGKPMHYKRITEEVLKRCKSVGSTPQNTMFARMSTDNKGRFKRLGKGNFSLTEWDKPVEVSENAH